MVRSCRVSTASVVVLERETEPHQLDFIRLFPISYLSNSLFHLFHFLLLIFDPALHFKAISAVLITFGALIGKISPFQLMVLTIIELSCHSFNYEILMGKVLNLADVGGTYIDHMFGAYFGLSVAFMLGMPNSNPEMGNTPDIFSLLGTLFLWIYWPSFVAGAMDADSDDQQRAIVNTILALSSSTVLSFWASSALSPCKRFRPVDIQNATLAGGVAIGATANLTLSAFSAIMIGGTAGLVSTFGFNHIQPFLELTLGLHDSCGVHNLHALPSVIGALASVLIAAHKSDHKSADGEIYGYSASYQWRSQLLGIFLCMGFAISTGLLTGLLLRSLKEEKEIAPYMDNMYWETADDFGRSLYGELAGIVSRAPGFAMDAAAQSLSKDVMEMTASHHGRRLATYGGTKLDGSMHGKTSAGFKIQIRSEGGSGHGGSGHGGSGHGKL